VSGNAASTFAARGLTTISQVVVFGLIVRAYGSRALDHYAVAFAIATFGGLVLDFGTSLWATRELAQGKSVHTFIRARLPLLVVFIVSMVGGGLAHVMSGSEVLAVIITSVAMAASLLAKGLFWGARKHDQEMIFAVAESWGLVGLLLLARVGGIPHLNPIVFTAIAYGAGAVGRWLRIRRVVELQETTASTLAWAQQMSSFGMQGIVTTASAQLDIILLSVLVVSSAPGTVAAYALALRVYYAAPLPLEALSSALLPRFVQESGNYRSVALRGTVAGTLLAACGVVVFAAIAPLLGYGVVIVHGLREALLILSCAFFARCAAYVVGAFVTARGRQRERLAASVGAFVTMVALDLLLIPLWGATGAAWAMVASDWVLLAGYIVATQRVRSSPLKTVATRGL